MVFLQEDATKCLRLSLCVCVGMQYLLHKERAFSWNGILQKEYRSIYAALYLEKGGSPWECVARLYPICRISETFD